MSRRSTLSRTTVKRRKRIVTYVTVEREIVSAGPAYTALAEILRMERGQAGLTQADFAKRLGISRPSLANIEAGRQRVLLGDFIEFANILEIEPQNLLARVLAEMNS